MLDIAIRNGLVVDGSGAPAQRVDVGIRDGRIVAMGDLGESATRTIDAEGQVISPGFIDGHTHMDAQINWDPWGTPSCWHGVTSVVMGNCGFTLAPCRRDQRALIVRNLERAEDISAEAMAQGIDWTWSTFPEYLDVVDQLSKGINYAANVGHSALRVWAMGEAAFEREATEDELRDMEHQLQSGLRAGAIGFSTSLNPNHATTDDRPVASRLASWSEETCRLVMGMKQAGGGIFELAKEADANLADARLRGAALDRMRQLAVESGIPMTFGVIANGETSEVWRSHLDLFDRAAEQGGNIFGQTHSRGLATLLSFKTTLPFDVLPVWRDLRARPLPQQLHLLRDPVLRSQLVHQALHGDYARALGNEARQPDWSNLRVYERPMPPNPLVADLARARGLHPVDLMIELALESEGDCFFIQPGDTSDDAALLAMMKHPRTIMTFSDAGAHVSQIADGSIHAHLLAYWCRERQEFTLEEAVHMVTARPAQAWGMIDRGMIRPGMIADINIFDPVRITPTMPSVASDLPGGAKRLLQRTEGIMATLVNGEVSIWNGDQTGALPGRLLRRGRAA